MSIFGIFILTNITQPRIKKKSTFDSLQTLYLCWPHYKNFLHYSVYMAEHQKKYYYYYIPLPLKRSVYLCVQGCRKPDRQQSTGTWSNKAIQHECELINLSEDKINAISPRHHILSCTKILFSCIEEKNLSVSDQCFTVWHLLCNRNQCKYLARLRPPSPPFAAFAPTAD